MSETLSRITYTSHATGAERDFFLYLPRGYAESSEAWPLLLFLHGNGERGDAQGELDYLLVNGPLYEAWIQKRDLPFIIVSPQLPLFAGAADDSFFRNRTRAVIPQRLAAGAPARPDETNSRLAEPMGGVIPANPEGAADGSSCCNTARSTTATSTSISEWASRPRARR